MLRKSGMDVLLMGLGGFLLGIILTGSLALKNLRISVPSAVIRGDDAILECFYELETDQLYSVKWYLGTTEFFRYTPKEIPPVKQFGGPRVREHLSDGNTVVLEHVSRGNSGKYTCEVTAEQPSFFTMLRWANLQVVDLPKKDPYITGLKKRYKPKDILQANCTSEESNPAANLTWYVNGEPVQPVHVHYKKFETADGQFYTAHSSLRLTITKHLHSSSKESLKIRCVASMYNIYYKVNEKSIEWEKKRHRQQHQQQNHHHHHHQGEGEGGGGGGNPGVLGASAGVGNIFFAFSTTTSTTSTEVAPYEHRELVQEPGNRSPTTREFTIFSSSTNPKLNLIASSLIFGLLLLLS